MPKTYGDQEAAKFVFKLRKGSHGIQPSGKPHLWMVLEPGDTLYTDIDMVKKDGNERWEAVQEKNETLEELRARIKSLEALAAKKAAIEEAKKAPSTPEDLYSSLDKKSIKELRTVAKTLDPPVDLTDCSGKGEIMNAIKVSMDAA